MIHFYHFDPAAEIPLPSCAAVGCDGTHGPTQPSLTDESQEELRGVLNDALDDLEGGDLGTAHDRITYALTGVLHAARVRTPDPEELACSECGEPSDHCGCRYCELCDMLVLESDLVRGIDYPACGVCVPEAQEVAR